MAADTPVFQVEKHISYWLRCLRTPLPHQYISNDANRMSLAFFTLSALDLLGALFTRTTSAERGEYADWIYLCQHPDGGFRAFPGSSFGRRRTAENAVWDPAHVPATYFALASLAVLGDDFSRVKRSECLHWLRRLQRPGGSFGETLSENNSIEGGYDTRFGYCAAGVRWILNASGKGEGNGAPDIDTGALADYIRSCESYDFGISQGPFHEAHAGLTYCAIGAASFLDRITSVDSSLHPALTDDDEARPSGLSSPALTTKWLLSRLTTDIEEDDSEDEAELEEVDFDTDTGRPRSFQKLSSRIVTEAIDVPPPPQDSWPLPFIDLSAIHWVGFNGRSNKLADTCYVFWAGASLAMLNTLHLAPVDLVQKYLLEKTQHLIMGGFGKFPGALPDLYHAYLGLAALSLLNGVCDESSKIAIEPLDPTLCVSARAKEWIKSLGRRGKNEEPG